jgi:hypothetical protein
VAGKKTDDEPELVLTADDICSRKRKARERRTNERNDKDNWVRFHEGDDQLMNER